MVPQQQMSHLLKVLGKKTSSAEEVVELIQKTLEGSSFRRQDDQQLSLFLVGIETFLKRLAEESLPSKPEQESQSGGVADTIKKTFSNLFSTLKNARKEVQNAGATIEALKTQPQTSTTSSEISEIRNLLLREVGQFNQQTRILEQNLESSQLALEGDIDLDSSKPPLDPAYVSALKLLGLPGEKELYERLTENLKQFHEKGQAFSLVYVDILDFQDLMEKTAAKNVLGALLKRVLQEVGGSDFLTFPKQGRFGLVLNDTNKQMAVRVARKIRANVQVKVKQKDGNLFIVRPMLGIVSPKSGSTLESFLEDMEQVVEMEKKK